MNCSRREEMSRAMWQSAKVNKAGKQSAANEVGGTEINPDHVDSGFLSDLNIAHQNKHQHRYGGDSNSVKDDDTSEIKLRHEDSCCSGINQIEEKERKEGTLVEEENEQMRADSGIVEVGLSQTISQLTLKPVTINILRGKVQSEPTIELSPVIVNDDKGKAKLQREEAKNLCRIYYSQDDDGDTQLHIAIVQGFHEVALSLIRMAPHPSLFDCLNQKRQSPLHLAVLTHQSSIARHLILAGADPSLRNSDGNTALHLASASGDLACARALTDPLLATEKRIYPTPGRRALKIPQDLEQPNYEGETCLHSAVVAGNTEIVRMLLSIGSDLEAKERLGGRTALHLAIESRRKGVTSLLLTECRPRLDALTYGGTTPYEIACCWDLQIAKELLKLGATSVNDSFIENGADEINKIPQLWQSVGLRV